MWNACRLWLIEKLKGYPDAESAVDSVKDVGERRRLLTLAVRRLYNTVGPSDILYESEDGQWMFQGRKISKTEQQLLISEAKQLMDTKLWKLLQADIKYQANRKMFILGSSETDIIAGKLWLFTLDAINTRLKSMSGGSGEYNKKVVR